VHAVLLTGGSAFGLAAADGVVAWLEERGVGYQTLTGVVPIVPAAVVFDLGDGRSDVRPGPDAGRAACDDAVEEDIATGRVGAGAGATVGKWAGREFSSPGGVGMGRADADGAIATAIAVVNSVGDVIGPDGRVLAGTTAAEPRFVGPPLPETPSQNTVLAIVAVQGALDKREVRWLATRGSDGITQTVRPAHTRYDGDVVFALAVPPGDGAAPANVDVLGRLATDAVAAAVRAAVST
jgi:L-aminopeptidase/D-esterase-like protein